MPFIPRVTPNIVSAVLLPADVVNTTNVAQTVGGLNFNAVPGVYAFRYSLVHQASLTTTGIKFSVDFSGVVNSLVYRLSYQDSGTNNLGENETGDNGSVAGFIGGYSQRAGSSAAVAGPSLSIDTANADAFITIDGIINVAATGTLLLYTASEVNAVTTLKAGSALVVTKIS